ILHKGCNELKIFEEPERNVDNNYVEELRNEDLSFLIVEDNSINAMILKKMLTQAGHNNYDVAVNGREAVEKFYEKFYDIIFMDLQMPICDG
ncbi:16555_t:CDS:2, partial [Acaulospora colombiana]